MAGANPLRQAMATIQRMSEINPVLRRGGFKKKGWRWTRASSDVVQDIVCEGWKFNNRENSDYRFSAGIYFPAVQDYWNGPGVPDNFGDPCQVAFGQEYFSRHSAGSVPPRFELTPVIVAGEESLAQLAGILENLVLERMLPHFEGCSTPKAALEWLEKILVRSPEAAGVGPAHGHRYIESVKLAGFLGDTKRAIEILEDRIAWSRECDNDYWIKMLSRFRDAIAAGAEHPARWSRA